MAVQILDKSFHVLETLSREFSGLSISELARRVDLNISTVHRILSSFSERGYVTQDSEKRYSLSLKFIDLSSSYLMGLDLKAVAEPILKALSEELEETVFLATMMDNQAVYIDRHDYINHLRCYTSIGERKPLYCTALGKSLLLGFTRQEQEAYVAACDFAPFTDKTLKDGETLLEELERSSRRGWTVDDEENVSGVICHAAPIYDYRGHVIAALSTSMNRDETSSEKLNRITTALLSTAGKVSSRMGFQKQEG